MKTQICGYTVERKLGENRNAALYLGRNADHFAYLKVLHSAHPTAAEAARLHNEFEILKSLEETGAVPIARAIRTYGSSLVLVADAAEDSTPLPDRTGPLGVEEFLRFGIRAADILDRVHGQGIFHKDIKPQNLILKGNGELELINFDIASRIAVVEPEIRSISALEGTLAFMSPEQTRRMNRPVDYRTDFYSLGVTFYQMLSGEVPFSGDNPMDIVYAHLAQQPQPLSEKMIGMPQMLSAIISKLLAKNAEDRYKSGLGLCADLQGCLAQWQATGSIRAFPLGECEVTRQLAIPQKLYGRTAELSRLLSGYDSIASGSCELILVCGYSGVGKTALVNELHPHVAKRKGTFISGKFDQFQVNTPYSAIGQALSGLIRGILSESSSEIELWKEEMLTELGDNARIIVDLVPELELILGEQPLPEALNLLESRNRFNLVFQNFLSLFARKEHPLILFLDDLQWSDFGSLDLIKTLLNTSGHLLIIGACRDIDVTASHPLVNMAAELRAFRNVEELCLQPLSLQHLQLMLAETLGCPLAESIPLAKLLLAKTGGNPFFTREFLQCLFREELLCIDPGARRWRWDLERIQAIDVTDNVVDLMTRRIKELPLETQHALQMAACLGNPFVLHTLAVACDQPLEKIVSHLWSAVEDGVITTSEDYGKFLQIAKRIRQGTFSRAALRELVGDVDGSFVHDRVQQAAYSLISTRDRPRVHLKIGQLLLRKGDEESESLVIVNHLNIGREHLSSEPERLELAELNLRAASKAQNASAYQAACDYVSIGIELLGPKAWKQHRTLLFELYLKGGESNGQLGRFNDAAEMLSEAFKHASSDLEKGKVCSVRLAQLAAQGRYSDAVQYGIEVLRELGLKLPPIQDENAVSEAFHEVYAVYESWVAEHGIDRLFDLKAYEDPRHTTIISILAAMLDCAIIGLSHYTGLLTVTMVAESCRKGNTPLSAFGYIWCGVVLIGRFKNYEDAYLLGELALKLNEEKFQNKPLRGRLLGMYGAFIAEIRHPFSKCIEIMELAYRECLGAGDLTYAAYALANSRRMAIMQSGFSLPVCTELIDRALERLEKLNNRPMFDGVLAHKSVVLQMRGMTKSVDSFDFDEFCYSDYLATYGGAPLLLSLCRLFELRRAFMFGDARKAIEIAESTDFTSLEVYVPHIGELQLFSSLSRTQIFDALKAKERTEALEKVRDAHAVLREIARLNPGSYAPLERILAAEIARIEEAPLESVTQVFDQAISSAKENGLVNYAALASELAGDMWRKSGCTNISSYYMWEAIDLYRDWGAVAKVRELENKYPALIELAHRFKPPPCSAESIETTSDALDLMAAVNASQTLSREIQLSSLLRKMMEIVIKISGARKVVLLTRGDGGLFVEAQVSMDTELRYESVPSLLEDCAGIAQSVVRYVDRTQRTVLLNHANEDGIFGEDEHIRRASIKSLMCVPVVNQQKLAALLYLENDIVAGAFTGDRARIINLLSVQIAISIENARLYAHLEKKVAESTREMTSAQEQLVITARNAAGGNEPVIRIYEQGDHVRIAEIFTRAIHEIACEFYTQEQCTAWSDSEPNPSHWRKRCELKRPFVAWVGGEIAGFLELDSDGHIDCSYIHPDYKRRGIMTRLVRHAVKTCFDLGKQKVSVEASLCAKPMFEKLGFTVASENMALIKGVALQNYRMQLLKDQS